jgi:hypothetical protein
MNPLVLDILSNSLLGGANPNALANAISGSAPTGLDVLAEAKTAQVSKADKELARELQSMGRSGKQLGDILSSSVRPNGSPEVPAGKPSNPATRPIVITEEKKFGGRGGAKFSLVRGIAQGEQPYDLYAIRNDRTGRVQAHCSCPDFKYRFEVMANRDGWSQVVESNGEWPDKTNPNGVASPCKHLQQFLTQLPW